MSKQTKNTATLSLPADAGAGAGTLPDEVVPDSQEHRDAIERAVRLRRDLWEKELEPVKRRCDFMDSVPTAPARQKVARSKLWSILWAMYVAGIRDTSAMLIDLRTRELIDSGDDQDAVSKGLECLNSALASVEYLPMENRLQVVTAPYPIEPDYLSYYMLNNHEKQRKPIQAIAEIVSDAREYSEAIKNWKSKHGRLVLDPEDPALFPTDPNGPPPGIYLKRFPTKWYFDSINSIAGKVKAQEKSALHVTSKAVPSMAVAENLFVKHPHLKACFWPSCDGCGGKVDDSKDEVVRLRRARVDPSETEVRLRWIKAELNPDVLKTVFYHYDCSPGYIGYCMECHKPLMDEAHVVRLGSLLLFHRDCIQDS